MSVELVAEFSKTYPRGPTIQAVLCMPAEGFHVAVLFGPSGCGKSTVLRCLAGLERPEAGYIACGADRWFDAAHRTHRSPQQRDVGFLFQDYALFPHLTVAENIGYGLSRWSRGEREQRVAAMLARFQLADLAERYPHQVSGGQQQRVALARVLARRPRLLLLDEPLSALDASLRDSLRGELRRLLAEFALPVVLVTHDRHEALALGDQLIVMNAGHVLQQDRIDRVFSHPSDHVVAQIVGIETIVPGQVLAVHAGMATVDVAGTTLTAVAPRESSPQVYVCLKAEDVVLGGDPAVPLSIRNQFSATVKWLTPEGPLVRVGLDAGFELSSLVTRQSCLDMALEAGQRVPVAIKASAIHLIPRTGTR